MVVIGTMMCVCLLAFPIAQYSSRETAWHGSTKYCTVNDNFEEENYDLSYSVGKTFAIC